MKPILSYFRSTASLASLRRPWIYTAMSGALILLLVGLFIWPTFYRYYPGDNTFKLIRVNRFTDDASGLTAMGWVPLERPAWAGRSAPVPMRSRLYQDELASVKIRPVDLWAGTGWPTFVCEIYNGTPHTIEGVALSVTIGSRTYKQAHFHDCTILPGSWSRQSIILFDTPDDAFSGRWSANLHAARIPETPALTVVSAPRDLLADPPTTSDASSD